MNNNLLIAFKDYLLLQKEPASNATIKNYCSDVRRFISWHEKISIQAFNPAHVQAETVTAYFNLLSSEMNKSLKNRNFSSLRKFFSFLLTQGFIISNPLESVKKSNPPYKATDVLALPEFKLYLDNEKLSDLTIKNYINDVNQFFSWLTKVNPQEQINNEAKSLLSNLTFGVINTYKDRLYREKALSPVSINRKLSSLRSYARFALEKELITKDQFSATQKSENITKEVVVDLAAYRELKNQIALDVKKQPEYSSFPPMRLVQKICKGVDNTINRAILPLAAIILVCQNYLWRSQGSKLIQEVTGSPIKQKINPAIHLHNFIIGNYQKGFYAPLSLSTENFSLKEKIIFHIRHTRPTWYKKYHAYPLTHYAHLGMLFVVAVLFGMIAFDRFIPKSHPSILGAQIAINGRTLRFNGVLLDKQGLPLQADRPLRFAIYNDKASSGSALLWEDTKNIKPDRNGNFSITLGADKPITESIFSSGASLFMGVSVANSEEMKPRQQLPNVAMSENSQRVMGLLPITANDAGSKNVLLALDSSGDLTILNTSPTFEASNGTFSLKAQSLVLSTLSGSNGNITLSPDGTGIINIEKPLQNISNYGSLPETIGAVEVADTFAILATSSTSSALTINQNSSGSLISASSGGTAKFTVDNTGSGYFANNLRINGTDLDSDQYAYNLFNRKTAIINLGGESIALTIGSSSGTTRIRNSTTALSGNLTIAGTTGTTYSGDNAGIAFSGNGNHTLTAESGSLRIGSEARLGSDVSILPENTDGTNNLGSQDRPFDTLYVNNIFASNINNAPLYWTLNNGLLTPINNSNDIKIGGSESDPNGWKVFGSGPNKATASSSGNLTFTGVATNINQLNGGALKFQTAAGGDSGLLTRLLITNSGMIGVGTTTPSFKLDVADTQAATVTAMISNLDSGANSGVLALKMGSLNPTTSNYFLSFLNGKGEVIGKIQSNTTGNGVSYSTSGSDFAEYFKKHDPNELFTKGNLICLHTYGGVTKCDKNNPAVLGVATDRPGFTGGSDHENDNAYLLVGISGQIPVLVSEENGPISQTDPITFSKTPGVGAKATQPSQIVGRSLGNVDEENPGAQKKVMTYVKAGWYDPTANLANLETLSIRNDDQEKPTYSLVDTINSKSIKKLGIFSEAIAANLTAGLLEAKELTTDTAKVSRVLMANLIQASNITLSSKLISPVAEIDQLRVRIISPLSPDDKLSLVFGRSGINFVTNSETQTTVFSVDDKGNASASGTMQAKNLEIDTDASIGGTLRVKHLIADTIEGQNSTSSATYITNIYQANQTSAQSSTPAANISTQILANNTLQTNFHDISSYSSSLAYQPQFSTDFATIQEALMVLGSASFTDITTSGQIAIGGNLILADSSINVLGKTLELQPLRQGNVSFMSGLVNIDTNGNLTVQGNAFFAKDVTIQGRLTANTISPLANQDLSVSLPQYNPDNGTSYDGSFIVQNASRGAVVKISNKGDINASGSGNFLNIIANNLNLVRAAQADTSLNQTIASSSAGTATILKGQKERTITSPYVSENSLIYISPTSDTMGMTPYIARQLAEDSAKKTKGSFTIQIPSIALKDISLNWWIIN